jgi:NAD(P)-dependent dehydrogenase (short-subunit alcohol dehydrogenase family)
MNEAQPIAIVTGAGSGIGRATAQLLADNGYAVVLAARSLEGISAVGAGLTGPSMVYQADVGSPEALSQLVAATLNRFGRIDLVVNNAGHAELQPIDRHSDELIERLYRVNAMGPAWLTAKVWPTMVAQRSGCIVNVSTYGTTDPFPGFFGYAAAKAATNLMARSCAAEGKEFNIRAFAVAPGAVETPMLRSLFDHSLLPGESCLSPVQVAEVIVECALGKRDAENGRTIYLPSP